MSNTYEPIDKTPQISIDKLLINENNKILRNDNRELQELRKLCINISVTIRYKIWNNFTSIRLVLFRIWKYKNNCICTWTTC